MVAKAFFCRFAQLALSLTVIYFSERDVRLGSCGYNSMNPDEGMVSVSPLDRFHLKIFKDALDGSVSEKCFS